MSGRGETGAVFATGRKPDPRSQQKTHLQLRRQMNSHISAQLTTKCWKRCSDLLSLTSLDLQGWPMTWPWDGGESGALCISVTLAWRWYSWFLLTDAVCLKNWQMFGERLVSYKLDTWGFDRHRLFIQVSFLCFSTVRLSWIIFKCR